jgi:hypothetical protein
VASPERISLAIKELRSAIGAQARSVAGGDNRLTLGAR